MYTLGGSAHLPLSTLSSTLIDKYMVHALFSYLQQFLVSTLRRTTDFSRCTVDTARDERKIQSLTPVHQEISMRSITF